MVVVVVVEVVVVVPAEHPQIEQVTKTFAHVFWLHVNVTVLH